ncbi:replication initiator protein A [Deinococcus pimensis]|uniref:replication initiator protein A n=1 Tax=Deinococcus pimensis TaxID=309888 RepID=UPI000483C61B|nr:replication initiator protein A [Deinococcus pimensis]
MSGTNLERRELREELNLVGNGLICIQRQIPPNTNGWVRRFDRDGLPREIRCRAPEDFGVPHGIDNDVMLGLQEEFIAQGCPDSNTVVLSTYALLKLCNLSDTGRNRSAVRESLDRMRSTTYWIKDSWRQKSTRRWLTVTFNLIDDLAYDGDEADQLNPRRLVVKLPAAVANSIREGYLKPVDLRLVRSLDPTSRHAYRALDSRRVNPDSPQERAQTLDIGIMELRDLFGLVTDRTDEIRRVVDRVGRDLVEVGYLKSMDAEGRGRARRFNFVFGEAAREPDARLVDLLLGFKVTKPVAERLVLDHEEYLEDALSLVRALMTSGYRPRSVAGFVHDVVRNYTTGKYAWPEGTGPARALDLTPQARAVRPTPGEAQEELLPQSDQDLARTVAVLLKLTSVELQRLPRTTLEDLKRAALGKPLSVRQQVAETARAMLGALD